MTPQTSPRACAAVSNATQIGTCQSGSFAAAGVPGTV